MKITDYVSADVIENRMDPICSYADKQTDNAWLLYSANLHRWIIHNKNTGGYTLLVPEDGVFERKGYEPLDIKTDIFFHVICEKYGCEPTVEALCDDTKNTAFRRALIPDMGCVAIKLAQYFDRKIFEGWTVVETDHIKPALNRNRKDFVLRRLEPQVATIENPCVCISEETGLFKPLNHEYVFPVNIPAITGWKNESGLKLETMAEVGLFCEALNFAVSIGNILPVAIIRVDSRLRFVFENTDENDYWVCSCEHNTMHVWSWVRARSNDCPLEPGQRTSRTIEMMLAVHRRQQEFLQFPPNDFIPDTKQNKEPTPVITETPITTAPTDRNQEIREKWLHLRGYLTACAGNNRNNPAYAMTYERVLDNPIELNANNVLDCIQIINNFGWFTVGEMLSNELIQKNLASFSDSLRVSMTNCTPVVMRWNHGDSYTIGLTPIHLDVTESAMLLVCQVMVAIFSYN